MGRLRAALVTVEDQQQLRQLEAEFADGLAQRLREIAQRVCNTEEHLDADVLFRQVHSLSGSAESFGFKALGETAQRLEQRLTRIIDAGTQMVDEQRQQLLEDVTEMQRLARSGPDTAGSLAPAASAQDTAPVWANGQACLIYLVEDDPTLGQLLSNQLQHLGYRVQLFKDRQAAESAIQQCPPDALVVDVVLPEGHLAGAELVAHMHGLGAARMPVMFISSRGDWEARLAAARAGGDAYLAKPLDLNVFFSQLEALLKPQHAEPYRVLLVDDMRSLVDYYAHVLRDAGMQVEALTRPEDILPALAGFKPELVLLDLHMPSVSGMDVAKVIRQNPDLFSVPIIFLSAEQDKTLQLEAMRQGDEFLQKPVDDKYLATIVALRVERARELGSLMYRDSLTGLLNHGTLKYQLGDALHRMQRTGQPLSVAMLDIDHFKQVNDSYGHPVGDRVLRQLARLLRERLRSVDAVGRYGGEEFCLIMPDTHVSAAAAVVDKLRNHFAGLIHSADAGEFKCSFSAGVTEAVASDTTDLLIKRADEALYEAKHTGRNRVVTG